MMNRNGTDCIHSTRNIIKPALTGVALVALVFIGWGSKLDASSPKGSFWTHQAVNAAMDLSDSSIQHLDIQVDDMDVVRTEIVIGGETWTLELRKHSLRSDDFQLLVQYEVDGPLVPEVPAPVRTYRGYVLERPDAAVRASYLEGQLEAVIATPEGEYGVQSLANLGFNAPNGEHVVYHADDWINTGNYRCGVNDDAEPLGEEGEEGGVAGTGLKVAELGLDADFEFYQQNGSNVNNTLADMENVINNVEVRYETAAIGITYEITTVIVRTVSGAPYTSSDAGTLLDQFQAHWEVSPQSTIKRDVAELFTGKNISSGGGTIGIAWLGTVCAAPSGLGYSVVQSRFTTSMTSRASLSAHELGHNWNAGHCNGCTTCASCCGIMCSAICSCAGSCSLFTCVEITAIVNFKNSRTCLTDLLDPQALPFFDDFPTTTLSTAKWTYNNTGAINTAGLNEPTTPNSMSLNASGSGSFQDDDLRTNFILLAGLSNVIASYKVQPNGVEIGEQLVVEYLGTNNLWNELNRITSDGSNPTTFTLYSHILPANAMHNEFRLRFRTEVSDTNDLWYIDDVSVSTNTPAFISQHPLTQTACLNGAVSLSVSAGGSNPITYQWKKNGVNIGGATSSTYSIASAQMSDAASYTCVVTNAFGNDESDPAVLTIITSASCNDGIFCNGVETCVGGACVDSADPCAEACKESTDTCQPYGTMSCEVLSTGATAGGTVTVELNLSQVLGLVGYEAKVVVTRTSGTGTMTATCPGGVFIDTGRADYVFTGQTSYATTDCANLRVASAVFNAVEVPIGLKYLGAFEFDVSPDAALGSTFEIAIAPAATDTFLRSPGSPDALPIPFDIGAPCEVTVVACGLYGDVAQPLNNVVNIDDILCVLSGFANPLLCPLGDIAPCFGDGTVNLDDILGVIAAFGGSDPCCGG